MVPGDRVVIDGKALGGLIDLLRSGGYVVVGPTVRDGAVVCDELRSADELPAGWTDEQDAGRYRLVRGEGPAVFAHGPGPESWKKLHHPPVLTLWRARREGAGFRFEGDGAAPPRLALLGVRACDLAAISAQDRVLAGGAHADAAYVARRRGAFVVAVSCTRPGGTCFCASMGTGPRATSGFDLALTELVDDVRHAFLLEVGTDAGAAVASELPHRPAGDPELRAAEEAIASAARGMKRAIATEGLRERLLAHYEDRRWDDVAKRCLTCGNCTLVCPTCFCFTVEDAADLDGGGAERRRRWDSCFTVEFSYIHGGSVRTSAAARYRQWLTHKLATWRDQFGTGGCVGCGRCITWCPAGIDITEEAAAVGRAGGEGGRRP
jgi:formate hydrogenlyase subunit 6/NADH:ubiquinone oxidoreductase subunit I